MNYELNETFKIDDDNKADWALRVIKENEEERERLINIAKDQIEDLKSQIEDLNVKYDNKSSYLKNLLAEYVMTVPRKSTKTQESYQLLTGKLIIKRASQKMVPDDEVLLDFLAKQKYDNYIKTKKSVDWAELKKHLTISDNDVIDTESGEVFDGIAIEDVPASFDIKLNKEEDK